MRAVAVIPARLGSTRFPGKILAARTGLPLIEHVWRQVRKASGIEQVVVATDDATIVEAVTRFGGEARMTRADHPNGTSRIAEVAEHLDGDVIVNVQGDEPEIDPRAIERVVSLLAEHPSAPMATLASRFSLTDDPADPNLVKVVLRQDCSALYFSRSPIPFDRDGQRGTTSMFPLRHIGLYGYRRAFLRTYVALPETPLERSERLEQLRALEHGHVIVVAVVPAMPHGIDTEAQYDAFVRRWTQREGRAGA